jgi:endonuclease/exonuclease/phosphatase family metal-dependent hydrolase
VTELVVLSYNIHRGVGIDRKFDVDRIADVIAETSADVVGLQEVIREVGSSHGDHAAHLAQRLGMTLVMGVARRHGRNGTYGNAVLTRWPVTGSSTCDLTFKRREPRTCLRVDLDVGGIVVHVFVSHFGIAMRERRDQVRRLAAFIKESAGLAGPRVLLGDFNEWHRGPVSRRLRKEFPSRMRRMRRTHPALFPLFALDRIYWDGDLEGREFHVHRTRLSRVASDHLPVVARLRVRNATIAPPYIVGAALPPAE